METPGDLFRYFIHGISFSIMLSFVSILWVFMLAVFLALGYIIGLVLAFGVLFLMMGAINTILTSGIWDAHIEAGVATMLVHGFSLFIILFVANFPSIFLLTYFPGIVIQVGLILVYAFVDGYIAKGLGLSFRQS